MVNLYLNRRPSRLNGEELGLELQGSVSKSTNIASELKVIIDIASQLQETKKLSNDRKSQTKIIRRK